MTYYAEEDTVMSCVGRDPELFFDDAVRGSSRIAKRICNGIPNKGIPGCPVRLDCLQGALERREEYGVFGGLDATERKAIIKASA